VEAVDQGFIFCDIVSGHKVEPDHVTYANSERGDENETSADASLHEGPVEVHRPTFSLDLGWW
jgi:hypothetical protein